MDFREFIDCLYGEGLLKRVTEPVDWKYEIGRIARNIKGPVLFDNIKDYNGCRVFAGGFSSVRSIAIAMGINKEAGFNELASIVKLRLKNRIVPIVVGSAEKRVVTGGDKVNLYSLPVPWWHYRDGGRYIGTWHINISKDPVSLSRNCGVYRMQLLSSNQTTVSVSPQSHLGKNISVAEKIGKDLQMAVAIGVDEAIVMAGGASVPFGVDEYEVAGALQEKPVELIKCITVDLEVPANAEYVLEGVIKCGVRVNDGPYFDYTGVSNINKNAHLFEVKAITRRTGPVFRGMSVGVSGAEDHLLFRLLTHGRLVDFHGSPLRQRVQNFFLKYGYYRMFQFTGRAFGLLKKISSGRKNEK